MTDAEIIKALECCSNRYNCYSCEYYNQYCKGDMNVTLKDALDLINRIQEENERLKPFEDKIAEFNSHIRVEDMLVFASSLEEWLEFCDNLKAEAYKEFAEKLKKGAYRIAIGSATTEYRYVLADKIDNLLKELVGEK